MVLKCEFWKKKKVVNPILGQLRQNEEKYKIRVKFSFN